MLCVAVLLGATVDRAVGGLGAIRDSVRPSSAPPPGPIEPTPPPADPPQVVEHHHYHHDHDCDDWGSDCDDGDTLGWYLVAGVFVAAGVTSPFWGPVAAVKDDYGIDGYFPRFPYAGQVPGYMTGFDRPGDSPVFEQWQPEDYPEMTDFDCWLVKPRRWSGRVRVDYGEESADLSRIGGHLLLSMASRWGFDAEMVRFEENLPGGGVDELWLGDGNLIFRFAQSEHMQWRSGLGFNWLDDPVRTDYGFNFTYGLDWFPRQPWILSATLDWGTLGSAELFHFRTTAGVTLFGIESYIGYEYYDLDAACTNSLIAGVRVWF